MVYAPLIKLTGSGWGVWWLLWFLNNSKRK
jgi:hypothetical protein